MVSVSQERGPDILIADADTTVTLPDPRLTPVGETFAIEYRRDAERLRAEQYVCVAETAEDGSVSNRWRLVAADQK